MVIFLFKKRKKRTETCTLCRKDTGIPRDCHVNDPRRQNNYIEGAGQVCRVCANTLKNEDSESAI